MSLREKVEGLSEKQLKLLWYCKMRKNLNDITDNFEGNYYYIAGIMRQLNRNGFINRIPSTTTLYYHTPMKIVEEVEKALKAL